MMSNLKGNKIINFTTVDVNQIEMEFVFCLKSCFPLDIVHFLDVAQIFIENRLVNTISNFLILKPKM